LARHELLTGRLVPDFGEPAAYFLVEISRLLVRDSMGVQLDAKQERTRSSKSRTGSACAVRVGR
jgi:hypothetical protein